MNQTISIGNRALSAETPALIVAELSANHLQDYARAEATIRAMKAAGADAVKLQTYTAETITLDCDNEYFRLRQGTLWDGRTLHDLYREASTPWAWQPKLKTVAEELGLLCFSSPFDPTAVDFLETMGVPAYKVASFEIVDLPLIEYIAAKGKPVILSTGIATLPEIEAAVGACARMGNDQVILLKCTSAYPASPAGMNLNNISGLRERFGVLIGLSDHTPGLTMPVAAVALGAKLIEKHFTLDRASGGPDAAFSMEPDEFAAMVRAVRETEAALGTINYALPPEVEKNRVFARSLFVVRDMKRGERYTAETVRSIRPHHGLAPRWLPEIIGRIAACDIVRGTPLTWELVQNGEPK